MTYLPIEGVLETIRKVDDVDPATATELLRYALYESLTDQIREARPRLEQDATQLMAKRAAQTRKILERQEIAKAHYGDRTPPNAQVEAGLDIIEEYVSKGIGSAIGAVMNHFDRNQQRSSDGRWVKVGTGSSRNSSYGVLDGMAAFTNTANGTLTDAQGHAANQSDNAREWNRPGAPGDRQNYRRLDLTGRALQHVSTTGSTVNNVGIAAGLVGNVGPEAERVLGPGIRRTAYRYRGTEKTPDTYLVEQVKAGGSYAEQMSEDTGESTLLRDTLKGIPTGKGVETPSKGAAVFYAGPAYTMWGEDQLALAVRGDTAALMLMDKIPNAKLADISIAAGELPPSQGILIDADGDVTSQAQGYNGDHYLPFDLRNLKDLHGGQYVRTRVAGGPTTEDIYTGLLSGARQVQVISNSGVFTVEFDPDTRGGRRYSDKATRMINRYGKLLEAIDGGGLFDQDVNAAERSTLRNKAYSDMNWDPDKGAERYTQLLNQARMKGNDAQAGTVSGVAEEDLMEQAIDDTTAMRREYRARNRQMDDREFADKVQADFEAKVDEANSTKIRQMMLDGNGYGKALKTLQQEFPFYIRDARYQSLNDFAAGRGTKLPEKVRANNFGTDRGYTAPGQTNARASFRRQKDAKGVLRVNDGRKVDTSNAYSRQVSAERNTAETARLGGTTGPGGTRPPVGGQRNREEQPINPNVYGKVYSKLVSNTDEFRDLIGPGSRAESELTSALTATLPVVSSQREHAEQLDSANLSEADAMATAKGFVHWQTQRAETRTPAQLAKWLMATDDQRRDLFLSGFDLIAQDFKGQANHPDNTGMVQRMYANVGGQDKFNKAIEQVPVLSSLANPFAAMASDPVLARPSENGDKPQPFDSITRMGDKPYNYLVFLSEAKAGADPLLAEKIERHDAGDMPSLIETEIQRYRGIERGTASPEALKETHDQVNAMQQAWSWLVARDLAGKLTPSTPAGSGSTPPLAPPPAGATPPAAATSHRGGAGSIRSRRPAHLEGHTGVSLQPYAGKKGGISARDNSLPGQVEDYREQVRRMLGI